MVNVMSVNNTFTILKISSYNNRYYNDIFCILGCAPLITIIKGQESFIVLESNIVLLISFPRMCEDKIYKIKPKI